MFPLAKNARKGRGPVPPFFDPNSAQKRRGRARQHIPQITHVDCVVTNPDSWIEVSNWCATNLRIADFAQRNHISIGQDHQREGVFTDIIDEITRLSIQSKAILLIHLKGERILSCPMEEYRTFLGQGYVPKLTKEEKKKKTDDPSNRDCTSANPQTVVLPRIIGDIIGP